MLSNDIYNYVRARSTALTYQIQIYFSALGYTSAQITGAIGYLRSKGLLSILDSVKILGRNEHLFTT